MNAKIKWCKEVQRGDGMYTQSLLNDIEEIDRMEGRVFCPPKELACKESIKLKFINILQKEEIS